MFSRKETPEMIITTIGPNDPLPSDDANNSNDPEFFLTNELENHEMINDFEKLSEKILSLASEVGCRFHNGHTELQNNTITKIHVNHFTSSSQVVLQIC